MKSKKVKRVVLGVGHPWFYSGTTGHFISLTNEYGGRTKKFRPGIVGTSKFDNNKVRLVMEILK